MEHQLNNTAWFESPHNRLKRWREFRQSLNVNNTYEVCDTVVKWWSTAPTVSISIDPVDSTSWPTPWEMLYSGDFCDDSKALGMAYTIFYTNNNINIDMLYLIDEQRSIQKLCALVDHKYLLNYEHNVISTKPKPGINIIYDVNIKDVVKRR